MISEQREQIKNRLKTLMLSDKIEGYETLMLVLRSDLMAIFSSYMILDSKDSLKLSLDIREDGKYYFNINAIANRIIDPGKMI